MWKLVPFSPSSHENDNIDDGVDGDDDHDELLITVIYIIITITSVAYQMPNSVFYN